jgi:hypothetical protein
VGFTNTSVYSLWFDRFIVGCHVRMGDDIRSDRSMCIELLIDIQREMEEYLERCETLEAMLNVSLHDVFLICGFCAGLRGGGASL